MQQNNNIVEYRLLRKDKSFFQHEQNLHTAEQLHRQFSSHPWLCQYRLQQRLRHRHPERRQRLKTITEP